MQDTGRVGAVGSARHRLRSTQVRATTAPEGLTSCTLAAAPSSWPCSGPTTNAPWPPVGAAVRCLNWPTLAAANSESWAGMTVPGKGSAERGGGPSAWLGMDALCTAQRLDNYCSNKQPCCARPPPTRPPPLTRRKLKADSAVQRVARHVHRKAVGVEHLHKARDARLHPAQAQLEAGGLCVCRRQDGEVGSVRQARVKWLGVSRA